MSTLRQKLHEKSHEMRKMFRKFDDDKSGTITYDEFQKMLEYYGMYISRAEVVTIMRALDQDGSGSIGYAEFMDAFAEQADEVGFQAAGGARGMKVRTPMGSARGGGGGGAPEGPDEGSTALDDYSNRVSQIEQAESRDRRVEQLLVRIARQMKASKGSKLREVFRRFDENKDHHVDRGEFRAAMGEGGLSFSADEVGMLEDRFFE